MTDEAFGTKPIIYRKIEWAKYELLYDAVFFVPVYPEKDIETKYSRLTTEGMLFLRAGYIWDGATGAKDCKESMRGALVHDPLYGFIELGLLDIKWKPTIDHVLEAFCENDGMAKKRANLWEGMVNTFGKIFIKKKERDSQDIILTAP